MPHLNVKYTLTLDTTVSLSKLRFECKDIDMKNDQNGSNYAGKIKDVICDDKLLINLKMTVPAWSMDPLGFCQGTKFKCAGNRCVVTLVG